jgi:hypothetical protein
MMNNLAKVRLNYSAQQLLLIKFLDRNREQLDQQENLSTGYNFQDGTNST